MRNSDGNTSNPDFIDILDLNKMVSTYNVLIPTLEDNVFYWKFLNNWLDYMETGFWTMLPRMWYETLCDSKNTPRLEKHRVNEEYGSYLLKRKRICERLKLDPSPGNDNLVKLHWVMRKDGEDSFISMAHTLMRVFLYVNCLTLNGLRTNASTPTDDVVKNLDRSFNSADQNAWPVGGNNSLERMKGLDQRANDTNENIGTIRTVGEWMES
jgi:hypothetical protein